MSNQQIIKSLCDYMNTEILGQHELIERLIIAILADGHLLVEGAPGLAKTRAIKILSQTIEGDFHRVQFTPDLLPADLTGTEVFSPNEGSFHFQKGPLFHNLILADEINRAPAKVQSALLEAMEERQITVGSKTYPLEKLFLVMATQNPIEQEGTYPLPEAQLDRFLLHVKIGYPDSTIEKEILTLARSEALAPSRSIKIPEAQVTQSVLFESRKEVLAIFLADNLEQYLLELVLATRAPERYGEDLAKWIEYGASPRASISLDRCVRARAWLEGRDFVTPEDIQSLAFDILRHRIILSYEAEADGITPDKFIQTLIERIPVP
ncbi:MoxR-like ATPase in aerotolerance operon [hydrothermal vent metagenome]|uniref:MoxR-like ATPase in aerotolerance operon n=1 Tax=hydrothermal vent metagenome TaxID=652676 RepID=A0A3B1AGI8_9ZZZZ